MFSEIGLLVLEGDAAGLAAKVSELTAARLARDDDAAGRIADDAVERAYGGVGTFASRRDVPAPLVHSPDS